MGGMLKVFSGQSNPALAAAVCREIGVELGRTECLRFSNENIKVKICENVRGCDVFFIQTSLPPVSEHLMELLIALDALRYASAGRITAVLPYYPYALADSKDEPRISITARLVADLLETAGASRILTVTLHKPQIAAFSRIPVDQLWATRLICDHLRTKDLANAVVVSPDIGSAKEASIYAHRLDLPLAIMDKRRHGDDEKARIQTVIGDIDGRDALLFDDEVLTGGSMIEAMKVLKARGAQRILAGCTHGVFSGEALERIDASPVERFVTTNTLPLPPNRPTRKIDVLSVARLLGDAIKAIHHGESVSRLLD